MEIIFLKPDHLVFLIIIPIILLFHLILKKKTKRKGIIFANFDLIKKAVKITGEPKFIYLEFFRFIFLIVLILLIAEPTVIYEKNTSSLDYVFIIDSSISMLVEDVSQSRFMLTKEFIGDFINNLEDNTKIGLISYSSNVRIEQELSTNKQITLNTLNQIEVTKKSNTELTDALIKGVNLFEGEYSGKIILFTDSLNDIDLNKGLDYLNSKNLNLIIIGVGTKEGGKIPGINIKFQLDTNLEKLTENSRINYFNLANKNFSDIKSQILIKNLIKQKKSLVSLLLIILLILYVTKIILLNTIYRIEP